MLLSRLHRTLYASLLRLGARFDASPALKATLTRYGLPLPPAVLDAGLGEDVVYYTPYRSMQGAVRGAFRSPVEGAVTDGAALDVGLEAMQLLHTQLAKSLEAGVPAHPTQMPPCDGNVSVAATPGPGSFLVAHPMVGMYWARSVVLVLDHCDHGALGVIVSNSKPRGRFSSFSNHGLHDLTRRVFADAHVHHGGPVSGTGAVLHRQAPVHGKRLGDTGIFAGGSLAKAAALVDRGACALEDVLLFSGAAVWSEGQLDQELKEGTWTVVDHNDPWALLRDTPLDARPDLWASLLAACGGEYGQFPGVPQGFSETTLGMEPRRAMLSKSS